MVDRLSNRPAAENRRGVGLADSCDAVHPESAGDTVKHGWIVGLHQHNDIRVPGKDDLCQRVSPAFSTVEYVIANQTHAALFGTVAPKL
jgi:hypothetical protein